MCLEVGSECEPETQVSDSKDPDEEPEQTNIPLQQLEVENRRLHANMTKLQLSFDDCCSNQTLDDGPGREELLKQYNQLQLEVDRWREECIQLHSILAKQTEGLKNVASINYGSHVHLINEVVELVLAFEAQKKINRHVGRYTCVTKIVMNIRLIMEILIESIIFTMICVADMLTVLELKQHIAVTLLPGLPAYILFMCIRHADCQNDYEKVRLLLTATIYTIEKVTKKGHDDIDIMVLWLSNTVRLLHNLKQYSGDKTFQTENTSLQNEQCLQNFDLTEYREVLSDTAVEIYQATLLMDTKFMFPVRFPFNPSKIKLEDIEVPEVLNLPMLKKVSTCEKQYNQLQLEVDRWREECIQLHSILAKQTEGLKNVASINYGSHVHLINEVVELVLAFEAQRKINRQLEDELHQEKNKWQAEREQLQQENEKLREENDNQHKLLSPSLTKSPPFYVLQEKLDLAKEELSKCQNSLKLQTEVLKDAGLFYSKLDNNDETAENSIEEVLVKRQDQRNNRRGIRKKERHYQGIFEFHKEDIRHIVRHVIFELKQHIAVTLLPGLPAYILFMYIRHGDCQNDYEKVQLLLTATIYTIEKVTKKGHDDIDIMVLWLSNTVRLLHNLKQYSGDKTFQTEYTSLQNEQCLQNFDLTEYREVLSDTAVEIYQSLAGHIQEKIEPLVVPAILEHEEISGLTSQIPSGKRGRAVLSSWDSDPFLGVQKSLDALLQELNYIYKIMGNHGVDPELTVQIFRQCTDVPTTLQPIIQAAHLLQTRKLDEDVQHVCNMCDKLSMLQATLLMDTKFMIPVRFPFNPSKIHLEDIEVPEVLNQPMLKKV
ncbi:unconventional myosin-Va-like [Schistocerca serialis cubense]|uniref:unconventional myosin-Va-like n=1 Tax=Schistocerca serialis cubense TaxID=2023355 RepID=UPI00214E53AB|nr:unconventional myosin-Va-like [Schistocerca serialis cubense]